MSGTTYQITLATDGEVAVTVTVEDPAEMKAGLAWAQLAYKNLADNQGKKDEPQVPEQQEGEVPICAVHNVQMARAKGKYGYFWSCHERTEDGFCTYKLDQSWRRSKTTTERFDERRSV